MMVVLFEARTVGSCVARNGVRFRPSRSTTQKPDTIRDRDPAGSNQEDRSAHN